MKTNEAIHFGPRLVGTPTGKLRAAMLVRPAASIESAVPLPGEPGAVYTRALEQHEILRKTLAYFGVETVVVEPAGEDPWETAVCDAAVAFEDGAMIMRLSAMSRRAESDRIESEFSRVDVPIAGHIAPPGLADGSDVLLIGNTAFVGVGVRGNAIGRAGFAAVAKAHGYEVVEVALAPDAGSLRNVVAAVARDTVVLAPEKVDVSKIARFNVIALDRGEERAAGVVCLGEHHVIADVRYRTALARMRKAGIVVEGIDLYDFEKVGITPSLLVLALRRD
jgi:dimethylargininase